MVFFLVIFLTPDFFNDLLGISYYSHDGATVQ